MYEQAEVTSNFAKMVGTQILNMTEVGEKGRNLTLKPVTHLVVVENVEIDGNF